MGKISIKKRLDNEIKIIEERLSSLNSSLKGAKNTQKVQESKYVDDIIRSVSLATSLSTKVLDGNRTLAYLNQVEDLSYKLVERKSMSKEIDEKRKRIEKARAHTFLMPLYNQIVSLKTHAAQTIQEIEKAGKQLDKLNKALDEKIAIKEEAEKELSKAQKQAEVNGIMLTELFNKYHKIPEQAKELEALIKNKNELISEIEERELEKLDLFFVVENSKKLQKQLEQEQKDITISSEQIDKINLVHDIEIEVNVLKSKREDVLRLMDNTQSQINGIQIDIDGIKEKLEEVESLQKSLLPSIGENNDNLYTLISKTEEELTALSVLLDTVKNREEDRKRLENINESYIFEAEGLNNKIKELNKEEERQNSIINEIRNEIKETQKEESSLSTIKIVKELNSCIDKANKIISQNREEKNALKAEVDEKNRQLNINYFEIKRLIKEQKELLKEAKVKKPGDIVSQLEIDRERIKLLKSAIDDYYNYDLKKRELEKDLDENYALHHVLSVHFDELKNDSEVLRSKINELRKEHKGFIEAFGGLTTNELRNMISENIAHSSELNKKIVGQAVLSYECNEKISQLESSITQKKLTLAHMEDRIDVLTKEISEINEKVKKAGGNLDVAKKKENEKVNKLNQDRKLKNEEFKKAQKELNEVIIYVDALNAILERFNEQIDLYTDKLNNGLKQYSFKNEGELKEAQLPKKEIERIEREIFNHNKELFELQGKKQVYLSIVAGKSFDPTILKKNEDALNNVDAAIRKKIKEYKAINSKNIEANYEAKNTKLVKEEIDMLEGILSNLKETKLLLEKDN